MCQAPGGAGFQSSLHSYRTVGSFGTAARKQNTPADMAAAQGEPRRRVEGQGELQKQLNLVTHLSVAEEQVCSCPMSGSNTCQRHIWLPNDTCRTVLTIYIYMTEITL